MSTNKNKKSTPKVRFGLMTQERATEINNGGATLTQWRRTPKNQTASSRVTQTKPKDVEKDSKEDNNEKS